MSCCRSYMRIATCAPVGPLLRRTLKAFECKALIAAEWPLFEMPRSPLQSMLGCADISGVSSRATDYHLASRRCSQIGLRRVTATMSPHQYVLEELKMSDFDSTSRRNRKPSLTCV